MTNANTLFQLDAQAYYEVDGFQDAVRWLRGSHARLFPADTLTIARIGTSAKTDIKTNAATQVVMIYVKNPSGSTTTGYLQLFNTSSASVTLGTTAPETAIKLSNAASAGQAVVFYPGTDNTAFNAAMSLAVTVTSATNTTAANATNTPTILVVYA